MECSLCGKNLSEGSRVCTYCYPPEKDSGNKDETYNQIYQLIRKSKAWVLVGLAVLPGWVSHPISYWFATKAMRFYNVNHLHNPEVRSKILRLRIIAGVLSLMYWSFTLWYLTNKI
jgi:hypothetical protein